MQFAAYGLDGFAFAAEAMIGRSIGAGDRPGFRAASRASLVWSLIFAALFSLAYLIAGPTIIRSITGIAEVRATALVYLPYAVLTPMVAVLAFLLDGIFIGATRTAELRNGMAVALAGFLLAAWLLPPLIGNHGLWLALFVLFVIRAVWLGGFYLRIERRGGFVTA